MTRGEVNKLVDGAAGGGSSETPAEPSWSILRRQPVAEAAGGVEQLLHTAEAGRDGETARGGRQPVAEAAGGLLELLRAAEAGRGLVTARGLVFDRVALEDSSALQGGAFPSVAAVGGVSVLRGGSSSAATDEDAMEVEVVESKIPRLSIAEATELWNSSYVDSYATIEDVLDSTVLLEGHVVPVVKPAGAKRIRFTLSDQNVYIPVSIEPCKGSFRIRMCDLLYEGIYQALHASVPDVSYMVRRVMDSGASIGMTSNTEAIDPESITQQHSSRGVRIVGFNGATESSARIGRNAEGFPSALLSPSQMVPDLELLCARDYASMGAVVLHSYGGSVLKLDEQEKVRFMQYLQSLRQVMKLKVENNIYVVDASQPVSSLSRTASPPPESQVDIFDLIHDAFFISDNYIDDYTEPIDNINDQTFAYHADIYTLGRVHFEDTDSRIFGLLLSGLTFSTLRHGVQHQSLLGLHPSITVQTLRKFERCYGRSPDIIQQANHDKVPNYHSSESEHIPLTRVGQHLMNDTFFSDYNEKHLRQREVQSTSAEEPLIQVAKRVAKLPSWGGAIAMNITVCKLSGLVFGLLLKADTTASQLVSTVLDSFASGVNCRTEMFSADSGIVSNSTFRVDTPAVRRLLLQRHIRFQRAVPHNHALGNSQAESTVRYIKRLQRLANGIAKSNPAIRHLGYTELDIDRCWGETFHWAVTLLLTRPAWNNPSITRYEAGTGRKFNIQTLPLLPIFSCLLAWSHRESRYVHCLYAGPSWDGITSEPTPGSIRAMYKHGTSVPSIFVTTTYKCVTSGAHIDTERAIQRSVERLMVDLATTPRVDTGETTVDTAASLGGDSRRAQHQNGSERSLKYGEVEVRNTAVVPREELEGNSLSNQSLYDIEVSDSVPDKISIEGSTEGDEIEQQLLPSNTPQLRNRRSSGKRRIQRKPGQQQVQQLHKSVSEDSYSKQYNPSVRTERYNKRNDSNGASMFAYEDFNEHHDPCGHYSILIDSLFADWSNPSESIYYSYDMDRFVKIEDYCNVDSQVFQNEMDACEEFGYRAVKEDVPRSWVEALRHPLWGDAARLEKDTLLEKSMVLVPREVAIEAVKSGAAEIVNLFPVYEEKVKEGKTVYKVRLVGDGRQQQHAGATYSETPSREEFRIFMHLVGHNGWDFFHCDEKRAFLNAPYIGDTPVYARLGNEFFRVIGALYGLKASPRHYQIEVLARLTGKLAFRRLGLCSCIYLKYVNNHLVLVFDYVDDFIWTGTNSITTEEVINEFRQYTATTPVVKNPSNVLGMDIVRNWEKHTIHLSMGSKIDELYSKISAQFISKYSLNTKEPQVPLTSNNVHIDDDVFISGTLCNSDDARLLDMKESLEYLSLVGGLLWQIGIRWDILYSVLYLTWFTHHPRVHHMKMAARVILYLKSTREVQLILGGTDPLQILTTTDATLNTAPKGRSVIAFATRLGPRAGLISAKCRASVAVMLSTFESELHGVDKGVHKSEEVRLYLTDITEAVKQAAGVSNMVVEMSNLHLTTTVHSDNKAMVDFVNGKGQAKGIKHALLRLWYLREQIQKGINLVWVEGKTILANPMTKAVHQSEHDIYTRNVQGYNLL